MSTLLGTTLNGRYRLEARIGAGGMSTVYLALDETLQRRVAIKLMNREVASDSDQLERFRREARAVAQLSHPHVVGVIDAGEDEGRPYIVLEYVEGETLKERIRRLGRLPIAEAVAYSIEVVRALAAAHARHIVHRDVKPQNVLIDNEGSAKVTDFGIARTLDEEGLTVDGRVLGTTDYVSPEQALGQAVTGQSDLYSLGIALYEMLTGEVPFKGENQVAVAMKHVREPLPDVRDARPEVSAALAAVVEAATAKRCEDRYANAAGLIADLEDVLAIETARSGEATGEVTSVLRTLPARKRRRVPFEIRHRRWAFVLPALALLVAAGVVAWLATRTQNGAPSNHPPGQTHGGRIALCATCANAYNPDGYGSIVTQNNQWAYRAVDGNASTFWPTEQYDGPLDKAGVGIYVDTRGREAATKLVIVTDTPGWTAEIDATGYTPNAHSFTASHWVTVGSVISAAAQQTVSLDTSSSRYRYYLVWITALPPSNNMVKINELTLYR